jgi:ribose transport system permease protein
MTARARALVHARPYLFALVLAIGLLVANVAASPQFGRPGNWAAELAALAPFALVAMASTPAIVSGGGGLDISIGPLTSLLGILLVAGLLPHWYGSPVIAIPLVLVAGAAVGAVNGTLVAVLRFQPVIATLGMFIVLTGAAQSLVGTPASATDSWLSDVGGSLGPVPGALLLLAAPLLLWAGLRRTAYIDTLYAVGDSDTAAFSAGVDVVRTRVIAYALGGLFAGVAAIAVSALLLSANASLGTQYSLIALAAVALGGTPLRGGRGGLVGSLLAAASIYLLQTLLSEVGVSVSWLQVVYGVVLAVGVLVSARLAKPAALGSPA